MSVRVWFVCVLASNVGVIYFSQFLLLLLLLLLLSTLVIIISIISKFGRGRFRSFASKSHGNWNRLNWILIFPCFFLCKHVISRLVQPSTLILCCTNCKTRHYFKLNYQHQSRKNYPIDGGREIIFSKWTVAFFEHFNRERASSEGDTKHKPW